MPEEHIRFYMYSSFTRYVLKDKMDCTVRFGTRAQGRFNNGTLRKQSTKPTVQFILSFTVVFINALMLGCMCTGGPSGCIS